MITPDEPGAIPMFVDRQRVFIDQNDHTWLCLHKTASGGTAQDIAHFFANDPQMASSHYVIGQDGTVIQVVQEVDGAAANCCLETGHASFLPLGVNLNVKTVSIEHVDPASDNSTPLTDAQKAASFKLVYDICKRHSIPMRRGDAGGGIIGHCDIAPLSRARCPGNYPWYELFTYLENGGEAVIDLNTPVIASYFTVVPGQSNQWLCKKTGKVIHGDMLKYYQTNGTVPYCGFSSAGLPNSNEVPIETFPGFEQFKGQGIVVQFYERQTWIYDPKHQIDNPAGSGTVYPAHLYALPGQSPVVAQLQAQLATAQQQLETCQQQGNPQEHAILLQAKQLLASIN